MSRSKGAVSLVSVKFKVLKDKLNDNDLVVIGRKWGEKAGIQSEFKAKISAPLTDDQKAGVTLVQ
jgi:hypothetical protein